MADEERQTELVDQLRTRATEAAQAWRPGSVVSSVQPLTGGASSLTYVLELDGVDAVEAKVVLKVAPPGLPPVRNRDVIRQSRLLRALRGHPGVAVPPIFFEDAGVPPEVPPFHAMGFVPGDCLEPVLHPDRDPGNFAEYHARGLDAARVLAAIHRIDPTEAGLGDEPVMTLSDEIDRWTRAFTTVPADLQGDYERCAAALHSSMPPALPPVVNHGDYRLGNTLCQHGRVMAVIDWEIWSLGDPRIDVTWFAYFTDEARHPAAPSRAPSGVPTTEELIAEYAAAGGAPLDDLVWFHALTRYKEAAATALLIKRGRKVGGELSAAMAQMTPLIPGMLVEAEQMIG